MIEPFTAKIPDADLDDLRQRLTRTRWAPEQPAGTADGVYGVPLSRVRRLVTRWQEFDWRGWEARLNAYPQFRTEIGGQRVHFLHARSAVPGALPVVLSHGWPGSVFEYIDLVGRSSTRPRTEQTRLTRSTWCSRPFPATASPARPAAQDGGHGGSRRPGLS